MAAWRRGGVCVSRFLVPFIGSRHFRCRVRSGAVMAERGQQPPPAKRLCCRPGGGGGGGGARLQLRACASVQVALPSARDPAAPAPLSPARRVPSPGRPAALPAHIRPTEWIRSLRGCCEDW